jgi:hypothetical protein
MSGRFALARRSPAEERQGNGRFYGRTRGGRTRPTEATSRPSRLVTRQRRVPAGQSPNAASRAASSASAALRGRSTSVVALSPSRNCRRKFGAQLVMISWMTSKHCDLVNEPPVRSLFCYAWSSEGRVTPNNDGSEQLIAGGRLTPAWRPFAYLRRYCISKGRRKPGVLKLLTSNGILAAASFLVGTALSKTVAHRQATFPLCA